MAKNDKISPGSAIPWKEILTFLGTLLVALIGYLSVRTQILYPIETTQTAEARLTTITAMFKMTQSAIVPSATFLPPPTMTETLAPSTSTPTITPSPTATQLVAYVILYKDADYSGGSLRIYLDDCGKVNISRDSALYDSTSSFELFAPDNVEIVLVQHLTSDGDYPGNHYPWQGTNGILQVNKKELKEHGVDDNVSSIQWLVDGNLLNELPCPPVK